ncbi:alpha/beta fold hydrolase [Saccharothrix obliqua]|uniref:alpha/beta fold hydrolase n=1 Tax=Saccharothrix obliqua TaxID=2861747 RepID=UPI001C5F6FBA|nr:alpha/beta fold hydrolase [Saccharothrix obliqua]MBW4720335.1 alpha/beta hydrolase [Saccharothrix obliqua]
MIIRRTAPAAVAAALAVSAAGLPAVAHGARELSWKPCATTAKDWPDKNDTRSECTTVTVPMDYAKPGERTIKIAVSRIKAAEPAKRRGVLVISPGGPGVVNIDAPLSFSRQRIGELAADHDLVGFDPRGVGYSEKVDCVEGPYPELPPGADRRARDRAAFDQQAEFNTRCTAVDPAFVRQLTTANIARDVDAIRAALGVEKIGFYGVSYGTAVGVAYRSLFDRRVDRMWLDSVMPPVMDRAAMAASFDAVHERLFGDFTSWLARRDHEYHFGRTAEAVRAAVFDLRTRLTREPVVGDGAVVVDGDWVNARLGGGPRSWVPTARDLATVRDGGLPPSDMAPVRASGFEEGHGGMNGLQYNAIMCNDGTGGRTFEELWADHESRIRTYPASGGGAQLAVWCAAWPWEAQVPQPVKGRSPLQLSGHADEDTTPHEWAVATRKAVGGTLLTVQDDVHGSLAKTSCAAKAVDFFRTGRTAGGTCPGAR